MELSCLLMVALIYEITQSLLLYFPLLFLPFSCHICRKRQEPNNILECKTCTNFFICLNCSEQSNHCHSLVKLNFGAKPKRVSSSVLPHDTLNSERRKKRHAHDLIKEITASSNGHLTARMLNEEIDMAWESEASDSGVRKLFNPFVPNAPSLPPENIRKP